MHLKRNHPALWSSYEEKNNKKNKGTASTKKEEKESCDMQNAEIRSLTSAAPEDGSASSTRFSVLLAKPSFQ